MKNPSTENSHIKPNHKNPNETSQEQNLCLDRGDRCYGDGGGEPAARTSGETGAVSKERSSGVT